MFIDQWLLDFAQRIWDKQHSKFHFVDPKTFGQYTGLMDRKRKRVFEGDVIRIENEPYKRHINAVVCFGKYTKYDIGWFVRFGDDLDNDGRLYLHAKTNNDQLCHELNYWIKEDKCCVIGNIYDNPELLRS